MDYNAQYQAYLNTAETALAQQADRCFNERSRLSLIHISEPTRLQLI